MKNNDKDQWFIVDDLEKFIESTRVLIFDNFGKDSQDQEEDKINILISDLSSEEISELNKILSQEECINIANQFLKKEKNKVTNQIRYIISTKKYLEMLESFNSRMVSNMLNHLVNKGVLDTAYDTECNDFVFWVKENDEKQEKPETD